MLIGLLFLIAAITPSVQAQQQCEAELELAQGVLRASALPERLSQRIESKLYSARFRTLSVQPRAIEGAQAQVDAALDLIAGEDVAAVPPDLLEVVREATKMYRACVAAMPAPRSTQLRVAVSRYTARGETEKVANARVRVNREHVGVTDAEGMLTVTVAADHPLMVGAFDRTGFAGGTEVTAHVGVVNDAQIVMTEGSAFEPSALTLDEIRADGLLPHDFKTLTLHFVDDEQNVPVMSVGNVVLQNEAGVALSLDTMFDVNAAGAIVVTKPDLAREALLQFSGPLSLHINATDSNGRMFANTVHFNVGLHQIAGRLTDSVSPSGVAMASAYVKLTAADGRVYRTRSDENGDFRFDYVPAGALRLEAQQKIDETEYLASDRLEIESDQLDLVLPMRPDGDRPGRQIRTNSAGPAKRGINTEEQVLASISATSAGHCAKDARPGAPPCETHYEIGNWFDIPKNTGKVTLRFKVTTEETVARITETGLPHRDSVGAGLRTQDGGGFNFPIASNNTVRSLWQDGDLQPPGTSDWIEYWADFTQATANGPKVVRLEAYATNCCVGDSTHQTSIYAEIYIENSCPLPPPESGSIATEVDACPPTLSVTNLFADQTPRSNYGDTVANNDGRVFSIPRPGQSNTHPRGFYAVIKKTPAEATLTGDLTLYHAGFDQHLTTVRVLSFTRIGTTDQYFMRTSYDPPFQSTLDSTPPPAHFIRYRFDIKATANEQVANKIVLSDIAPYKDRALWRMPDTFAGRRFGGGHANGGDGEPGGDNWASRGAYDWMDRNEQLLTRINDISGEHGMELKHSGHGYGTDIDQYHYVDLGQGGGDDPIGQAVYDTLKSAALTAQHPGPNRAAAIATLGSWVRGSRDGIDNLLALPETTQIGYIIDGGEWGTSSRRRACCGGGPPPSSGLLPGWGRDLLRTGTITYGDGAFVDTNTGLWANRAHAKMMYWHGHHNHIHITLNRCIVDTDGCPTAPLSCSPARITNSPDNDTIDAGESITLSAGASGSGTMHYQWYASPLNSNEEIAVPNSNSASITVSPNESMIYRVEVTNGCGGDQSAAAVVTVNPICVQPTVNVQPLDQSIISGDTATISVDANGTMLSYQWYYGLSGDTSQAVPNGTGATLEIAPTSFTRVWVRITNACGTVNSDSASIFVSQACVPISINTSPASKTIIDGEIATLSVHASGTGPYDFDWFIGQSGDTSNPLPNTNYLIKVSPLETTDYWVRVTNACGTANSATARVTVLPGCTPPTITSQPHSTSMFVGSSASLSVSLAGSVSTVQWLTTSGVNVGTGKTISVSPSTTTSYYAHVTNACGTVDSTIATVTVNEAPVVCTNPVISTQPANTVILAGNTATLSVAADVTAIPVSYQWFRGEAGDDSQPVGTDAPSYTTDILIEDAKYWVRLTRGNCVTNSEVATITVCSLDVYVANAYTRSGQSVNLTAQLYGLREGAQMTYTWYRGVAGDTSTPIFSGYGYQVISVAPATTTKYWVSVTDGTCSATSDTVTVSTCIPVIGTQPQSQLINSGTTATLSVTASGDNLHYQWYQRSGGSNIAVGTNSPTFTTPALSTNTTYWVRISGCGSPVSSADAVISICQVPYSIASQSTVSIIQGHSALLSVNTGGTTPALQWYQGASGDTSTPLAGKTSSTLVVAPTATTQYWCRASNQCGTANSTAITVDVCTPPSITTQPANVTIQTGTSVTLSVVASTSPGAVTYQWFQGLEGDTSLPVGTSSASYTTDVLTEDTHYWVRVTRGACSTDSAVAKVTVCSLSAALNSGSARSGQSVTLTSSVYGARDFATFDWYRGNAGDISNPIALGTMAQSITVTPTTTTKYWFRVTDGTCTISSNTATISVCIPTITAQPQSILINSGQTTTLSVTATGDNLNYQWYQRNGGTNTPVGTNSPTFTTPALTSGATYWVRVTGCTNADSNDAVVSICQIPTVSAHPTTFTIQSGQSAAMSVTAGGTNPTYQWYQGASGVTTTPLAGKTSANLTVVPSSTTQYWCRVTNQCGTVNGPTITVDVCTTPSITTQPANVSVPFNSSATLSVAATASAGTITYQWYQGDAGDTSTPVGTNSSTFTTPLMQADTQYWVRVTRGACSTNSSAATVYACVLSAGLPDRQTKVGQSVTLTASVGGARDFVTYDWYRGIAGDVSNPIAIGTAAQSITVTPTTQTKYWFRVTDGTCTVSSNTATVSVCVPNITAQPQSVLINSGQTTTLSVTATGEGLSYQWYQRSGSTNTPVGTNSPSFTTPALTSNATYWVRITGCSVADSSDAVVSICQLPTVSAGSPTAVNIISGYGTTMSVTAGGTNPTYQWYQGASGVTTTPLAGKTSSSLTVAPTSTTQYWCRVTNPCGAVNGPTFTVDVCTYPTINTQPANKSVPFNTSATLSVSATASAGALAYQWFQGDSGDTSTPVGTNSATFTTPLMQADTQYWVRVTRGACSTNSSAAMVYACVLSAGLPDRQTKVNQSVTLTASVGGARDFVTYDWYRGIAGDVSNPIAIGTSAQSITVTPTTQTKYWFRVTDGTCTVSSNTATVSVCVPNITAQPQSKLISSGQTTTLSVTATGEGLNYQWYQRNGSTNTPVGTNSSSFTTPALTSNATYWVRITGCSVADSTDAVVSICQLPTATAGSPTTVNIISGYTTTLTVNAGGTSPTYQWYQGASGVTTTPLAGKTTNTLVIGPSSTTQYWCRVTNPCGTANGPTMTVDVCSYPTINTQPANIAIPYNTSTTLSVSATASAGALAYQWFQGDSGDTSTPVGTNSATFTTPLMTVDTKYWVRVTRGACSTNSAAAMVYACQLSAGLGNYQTKSGQSVTLNASVSGARDVVTYSWYRGLAGDTTNPIAVNTPSAAITVSPTATTKYWFRVTDGTCTVNSNAGTVSVCVPNITAQPANVLINNGQSTTLSVTATGEGLTYQWFQGAAGVTTTPVGTNSPSLTVTPATTTSYWVRITGCSVVNSTAATVTVCVLPSISQQPYGYTINRYQSTSVSVTASGTNLSYQWYRGESGVTTTPVGTNSPTYTASYVQTTRVWVKVTGSCGSVNSAATTVSVYPVIQTQPVDRNITRGTGAQFSVLTDSNPVSYQWYQGHPGDTTKPQANGTGATFTSVPLNADTPFFVRLTSGNAIVDSTVATAYICPSPTVNVSNPTQVSGSWVTLSIADPVEGDTYKWYRGNSGDTSVLVADTGSTSQVAVNPTQTTNYWVRRSNAVCSADSATTQVYVCVPAITSQPQGASITSGQTTRLSVTATGTPALTYQWYTTTPSVAAIPGATNSYVDVTPSATQSYYVRVSSAAGCAKNSDVVTVNVCQLPVITAISGGGPQYPGYSTGVSVTATGTNLTYQWYRGQSGDTSYPVFTNVRNPTFSASTSNYFWVRVSNSCGSVNSAAVLNSVYATTYGPYSTTIPSGTKTKLTVAAYGNYLSYQWYLNDLSHPIAGATGPSYTTPNLTTETTYYVAVTSGTATKYPYATVSICPGGPILDGTWTYSNGPSCFLVGVNVNWQNPEVTYTWYQGETGDTSYEIGYDYYVNVCPTVQTKYWCRVWFADGSCYTDTPTITVR